MVDKYRDYVKYIGGEFVVDKEMERKYYYYVGYEKGQKYGYKKEFAEGLAEVGSENAKAMLEGYLDGNGGGNVTKIRTDR